MITSLFSAAESAPSAHAGDCYCWTSFVPGEILWLSHMHLLWAPFAVLKFWEFVCRHLGSGEWVFQRTVDTSNLQSSLNWQKSVYKTSS